MFNTVAVVGATGAVGRIIMQLLEQRRFPARTFSFFASARSAGQQVEFASQRITIEELTHTCFQGIDLVIASTPDETAAEYLPSAVQAGCRVIDESGYWRMHSDVALVVPEINPQEALNAKGIIASPNCSTTQMVLALKPLHDAARVRRVIVSTYQATSGAGLQGTADLLEGSRAALAGTDYQYQVFRYPIAFNAIPQIGSFKQDGYTSEELKMVYETRKILGDDEVNSDDDEFLHFINNDTTFGDNINVIASGSLDVVPSADPDGLFESWIGGAQFDLCAPVMSANTGYTPGSMLRTLRAQSRMHADSATRGVGGGNCIL